MFKLIYSWLQAQPDGAHDGKRLKLNKVLKEDRMINQIYLSVFADDCYVKI